MSNSNNLKAVTLVIGDDWSGLYVDGELVHEDRSVADENSLAALQKAGVLTFTSFECDGQWQADEGYFPRFLEDVKKP